jgi:hypothetical protein
MILDCDPNAMAQDIRMVCNSTDTTNNGCAHMLNGGAEGKLVRLPPNVSNMFSLMFDLYGRGTGMEVVREDAIRYDFPVMGACRSIDSGLDEGEDRPSRWC